jgi:formylglycine-generating enzyme required for sulfatase activity
MIPVAASRVTLSDRRTQSRWQVDLRPYEIAAHQVTQAQYAAVTGTAYTGAAGLPATSVSWWNAVRFCNALSKRKGLKPAYTIRPAEPNEHHHHTASPDEPTAGENEPTAAHHRPTEAAALRDGFTAGDGGRLPTGAGTLLHESMAGGDGGGFPSETGAVLDGLVVVWDVAADGYRLPTEAEWEHACRAGTTGPHYGPLNEIAWYRDNSDDRIHEVGGRLPNAWSLHDMLGNAWDWCWDLYDPEVYGSYRVLRGGGWFDEHWSCRASVRRRSHPTFHTDDVSFRLARSTQPPTA